jgi:hypothetical protein
MASIPSGSADLAPANQSQHNRNDAGNPACCQLHNVASRERVGVRGNSRAAAIKQFASPKFELPKTINPGTSESTRNYLYICTAAIVAKMSHRNFRMNISVVGLQNGADELLAIKIHDIGRTGTVFVIQLDRVAIRAVRE